VKAAQLICDAEVTGDYKGSTELFFSPGKVKAGDFCFDTGTAGSAVLVLQTVIPPLIGLQKRTTLTLTGGTHVPLSPSYDYLAGVFVPVLRMLGIEMTVSIESYGFYPKGGGKIRVDITPPKNIRALRVRERGKVLALRGCSAVGNLPLSIAERQRNALVDKIHSSIKVPASHEGIKLLDVVTPGQGTFVYLQSESENSLAGFTALGAKGKKAETVGEEAAAEFLKYYASGAAFAPHLPDQIVLYLSLCRDRSEFTTSAITTHLMTNLWAIGLFHEFRHSVQGDVGQFGRVKINQPADAK